MSYDQVASPTLRQSSSGVRPRERATTISTPTTIKRVRKLAARRLAPGQTLLTGIWGKDGLQGPQ